MKEDMSVVYVTSGTSLFLLANSVWDFSCAFSLFLHIPPLNSMHTALWVDETDSINPAARHLMACLVFTWGGMRLAAGIGASMEWACLSYLIEGFVFGSGVATGRMRVWQGMCVSLSSLVLAVCFSLDFQAW